MDTEDVFIREEEKKGCYTTNPQPASHRRSNNIAYYGVEKKTLIIFQVDFTGQLFWNPLEPCHRHAISAYKGSCPSPGWSPACVYLHVLREYEAHCAGGGPSSHNGEILTQTDFSHIHVNKEVNMFKIYHIFS